MLPIKLIKITLLIVCIHCFALQVDSQTIKVKATNEPLNQVFFELRDKYNIQFSFNDILIASCVVSDSNTYDSPELAISNLIKNCDLEYEITKDVFVIFQKSENEFISINKKSIFLFSGKITDKIGTEPLPYSSIQINTNGLISDLNGNFSFKSNDSIIDIAVSYLGYFQLDTTLKPGIDQQIQLSPSVIGLQEVVIDTDSKIFNTHIGDKPGLMKLNHQIASFLPGNNDNTVFNLLRLKPGILASAEQSTDYIIWGSYKGQTLIEYDGIPLFSVSSLNEELGVINPLLIKDVEILKGGYNVQFGGRVGSVVNITGNTGNPNKFGLKLNINNQATSGLINIPIADKYALQLSYRQSYYDLLNFNKIIENDKKDIYDLYEPEYKFRDFNVKFSGSTEKGDNFYLSLLGNNDGSSYQFSKEYNKVKTSLSNEIEKQQLGGTFYFNKNWHQGGSTNASVVYSNLNTSSFNSLEYNFEDSISNKFDNLHVENSISELSIKVDHIFPTAKKNSINTGLEYIYNTSGYQEDSSNIAQINTLEEINRISYFLKDNIVINRKISFQPGFRIDLPLDSIKPYIQPRIDVIINPTDRWNVNLAWGIYNQFVSENAIIDDLGNYRFLWNICDDKTASVLKGMHYIAGFSYNNKGVNVSVEGYYKTTSNLSRFIKKEKEKELSISYGDGRSFGIDFYVKKEIKNHEFWVAYTLSRTEELFDYFKTNDFQMAPQDQRHELKGAALFNFYPFFFSANYVYGSGLAISSNLKETVIQPYNRFDIAFMFRFNAGKVKMETGFSVLNLFNTYNIRYNGYSVLSGGNTVYSSGIPFTPSIFFNFGF